MIENGRRSERLGRGAGLDHHELAGARLARDLGVLERQQRVGLRAALRGRRGARRGSRASAGSWPSLRRHGPAAARWGIMRSDAMILRTLRERRARRLAVRADMVVLTLFLNPHATLRADGAGAAALPVPALLGRGHAAPLPGAAGHAGRGRRPARLRPPIEGLPWFTASAAGRAGRGGARCSGPTSGATGTRSRSSSCAALAGSASAAHRRRRWCCWRSALRRAALPAAQPRPSPRRSWCSPPPSSVVLPLAWRPLPAPAPAPVPARDRDRAAGAPGGADRHRRARARAGCATGVAARPPARARARW